MPQILTMKILFKLSLLTIFLVTCSTNEVKVPDDLTVNQKPFLKDVLNVLSDLTDDYGKDSVNVLVSESENGNLSAEFNLSIDARKKISRTSKRIAVQQSDGDGTTCSGFDCVDPINDCFDDGKDAIISQGACNPGAAKYCVTCTEPDKE